MFMFYDVQFDSENFISLLENWVKKTLETPNNYLLNGFSCQVSNEW